MPGHRGDNELCSGKFGCHTKIRVSRLSAIGEEYKGFGSCNWGHGHDETMVQAIKGLSGVLENQGFAKCKDTRRSIPGLNFDIRRNGQVVIVGI